MTERELARGDLSGWEAVTAFNAPVFESHAGITATVRQHLGVDAAALFAKPAVVGREIVWTTNLDGRVRDWAHLSPADRYALDPMRRNLGNRLADLADTLRRGGVNTRSGNFSHLLEAALVVPGVEHLHLVDDHPVLTFWGFRRHGERGLDPLGTEPLGPPSLPPPPPVRKRRVWPWLVLFVLSALVLAGGAWWWWSSRVVPAVPKPEPLIEQPKPPPASPLGPPKPEPKPESEPKPPEPPPPPPELAPVVTPPPAPHADLPKQPWDQHDLSVLEGCWILGKEFRVQSYNMFDMPGEAGVTRAAQLCLDKSGHGHEQAISDFPSGRVRCDAPVRAYFGGDGNLMADRPGVGCSPPRMNWMGAHLSCVRRDDSLAVCTEMGQHGSTLQEFRRAR